MTLVKQSEPINGSTSRMEMDGMRIYHKTVAFHFGMKIPRLNTLNGNE